VMRSPGRDRNCVEPSSTIQNARPADMESRLSRERV
jgi:hypothetical protein